ncbi:hemolysin family protein [Saccharothrix violaceirubra]|uniref:CBS domain containing-hemolysin-like protein n=1 Tax=Saccharothrix violaceirubra TaxID=413306 RepID=A0A7W7T0D2_9PSEU|nr:hemolysin family protein [Saccharothrix violaceirubra]MBB4964266.1 CBS domain containing-hemolysin-like protein [Saccharothrix violaceirubra]
MSPAWALVVSLVLLVANAFFVAAEFALIAARRHRLEHVDSRAARAAVAGIRELSLMLAGAQLGITLCTLGLGALAKPAVADLLDPLFAATGLPESAAYAIAFTLSLVVVVFLHMVVGEMAPKSWAITHPERSALLLAIPFRFFARSVRFVLGGLNRLTNALLRLVKVEPRDELAREHRPDDIRLLVRQSGEHGLIPEGQQRLLTRMLQLQRTTVEQIMVPIDRVVGVTGDATAADVEHRSRESGRSRFPVVDATGAYVGLVHVREAVRTPSGTARDLMSRPLVLSAATPVAGAVTEMRAGRAQLALVTDAADRVVGIAALEDLLEELIGDFEDETDPS